LSIITDRLACLKYNVLNLFMHIKKMYYFFVDIYTVSGKRTYKLPWKTLTNLNVFLLFLAHIIPMNRVTNNM